MRGFAFCLTAATALGTCAQFVLGALAPFFVSDLGLTRAEFGTLSTVMFAAAIVATPFIGALVDSAGGGRMIVVMLTTATGGLVVLAAGVRYSHVLGGVVLAGVATAFANPATNQLIARHIPRPSQGAAAGLKQSGVHAGAFVVGLFLPRLASAVGWRFAVAATAATSLVVLLVSLAVLPPSKQPLRLQGEHSQGARYGVASWRSATVWWLSAYAFLMGAGVSAVTAYLALYGFEELHLSQAGAGALVGALGATAVVARILWGRVLNAERLSPRALVIMAGSGVACIAMLIGAERAAQWLAWPAVVGLGAGAASWTVVAALVIVRRVPIESMGKASATVQVAFYGGFVVTPAVFGAVVDRGGGYASAWFGVAMAFAAGAVCAALWARRERERADAVDAVAGPHAAP